jgi:hypothetical protein
MERNRRNPDNDQMSRPAYGRSHVENVPDTNTAPRGVEEVDGEFDEFDADEEGVESAGQTRASTTASERQAAALSQPHPNRQHQKDQDQKAAGNSRKGRANE